MSEQTFDTQAAARDFLRSRFTSAEALKLDQAAVWIDTLDLVETRELRMPPEAMPAMSKRFHWVIQNDDLQLADTLLDCIKNAAALSGLVVLGSLDASAWTAITGISGNLFKLLRRAINKGKVLDPRAFDLLWVLREVGPLPSDKLTSRLKARDTSWTTDEVDAKLKDLSTLAMNDGTTRALVTQDAQNSWRTVGV
jgi:hypothetical protein